MISPAQLTLPEQARVNYYLLTEKYMYLPWDSVEKQEQLREAYIPLEIIPYNEADVSHIQNEGVRRSVRKLTVVLGEQGQQYTVGRTPNESLVLSTMKLAVTLAGQGAPSEHMRKMSSKELRSPLYSY